MENTQISTIPQEILEKIASYTNGYVCCVLGLDLSLSPIRQCIFWSGGPGVVLSEILVRGGDPRALLTVKNFVPSSIAIAKAVMTKNKKMLHRTFAIWESNISDGGLKLAMEMDLGYAVELIRPSFEESVRHRNAYYISKGMYHNLDETIPGPFAEIYALSGDVSKILDKCDDITRMKIMALEGNRDRIMEVLDSGRDMENYIHVFSNLAPTGIVVEIYNRYKRPHVSRIIHRMSVKDIMALDEENLKEFVANGYKSWMDYRTLCGAAKFSMDNGLEEPFLDFIGNSAYRLDGHQVAYMVRDMYHGNFSERWKEALDYLIEDNTSTIVEILSEEIKTFTRMIEDGYNVLREDHDYRVEYVKKGVQIHGKNILDEIRRMRPYTIEDFFWCLENIKEYTKSQYMCVEVVDGTICIPEEVEVDPYDETWKNCTEWLSSADVTLCAMNLSDF